MGGCQTIDFLYVVEAFLVYMFELASGTATWKMEEGTYIAVFSRVWGGKGIGTNCGKTFFEGFGRGKRGPGLWMAAKLLEIEMQRSTHMLQELTVIQSSTFF